MPRSTIFDVYQNAYYKAATQFLFREFNPVRLASSFVYNSVGSGGLAATNGLIDVSRYRSKEIYYQPRILNSGSVAFSIEGKAAFMSTWTQLDVFTKTSEQATWYTGYMVTEEIDHLRVGVRAASPGASDIVNIYLGLK